MKNLINYVVLFVAIVVAVLAIMSQGVNASGTVLFPSTTTNQTTGGNSAVLNTAATDSNNTATEPNSVAVNNLNSNATKDQPANNTTVNVVNKTTNTTTPTKSQNLPQTGENDVYIVTAVGVAALAIGTVAYIKSRKYDV